MRKPTHNVRIREGRSHRLHGLRIGDRTGHRLRCTRVVNIAGWRRLVACKGYSVGNLFRNNSAEWGGQTGGRLVSKRH